MVLLSEQHMRDYCTMLDLPSTGDCTIQAALHEDMFEDLFNSHYADKNEEER